MIMMIKMTMRMVTIMLMLTTRWMLVLGLTCSVVVTLGLVVVTATLRRNTRFIIIIVFGILSNIIKQARTRDNLTGLANTDQRAKNPDQTTSPWPSPNTRWDSGEVRNWIPELFPLPTLGRIEQPVGQHEPEHAKEPVAKLVNRAAHSQQSERPGCHLFHNKEGGNNVFVEVEADRTRESFGLCD